MIQEVSRNVLTHGIAIKPGKPTLLAADEKNHTVLAGLPGHPMAAALMFRLLIADWQRKRMHMAGDWKIPAVMEENVSSNQGRATVLPVVLRAREDGYTAVPVYAKSGCISALSGTDGFVYIERNREGLKKGEIVFVEVWR